MLDSKKEVTGRLAHWGRGALVNHGENNKDAELRIRQRLSPAVKRGAAALQAGRGWAGSRVGGQPRPGLQVFGGGISPVRRMLHCSTVNRSSWSCSPPLCAGKSMEKPYTSADASFSWR